uniref:C3a anaphylatoxin chemotactic receptor n=1 Tax=Pelodiscus sinensis TaxID=13735 RepID=K7EW98_PELSI|nr:C3a anaphylatoxin chemotactic receptor [Pelodiscus sinensis]XP_006119984.1 C3a anaphylatoxin chemotactic receptor [Pelodiscus sinensis]XP_025038802.1 C3a anaphylatoxin chemotactic receptor [Pelodiscus sinensis]|eukprot:XP_006119983.1 C3a anaphylatoxin chemotactic receptor [Pelodiscus sinensis]
MSPLLSSNSTYKTDDGAALQYTLEIIVSLIIFILTFILGLLGNGLVIWVAGLKMKRTVNTIWFLHLAIADFLCCMSLPFSIIHLILHEHWPYGYFLCKVIPSAIIFNMFASVFLLTAISIDRCLIVMKPVWCQNYRTVRLASVTCVCIWLLAFVMCCPAFLYRETSKDAFGKTVCVYNFEGDTDYMDYGNNSVMNYDFLPDDYPREDPTLVAAGTYEGIIFTHQPPNEHPDFRTAVHTRASSEINTSTASSVVSAILSASADMSSSADHPDSELTETAVSSPNVGISKLSSVLHSELSETPGGFSYTNPPGTLYDGTDLLENWTDNFSASSLSTTKLTITIPRIVFGFLLPFSIMATCYILIATKMHGTRFTKPRGKTLRVILVVVAVFFVCWAPFHIVEALYLLAMPGTKFREAVILWDHLSTALAYTNSCINPFLYVFVGRDFRQKARQSVRGILENAFSEEVTRSTFYSRDKTKSSAEREISSNIL